MELAGAGVEDVGGLLLCGVLPCRLRIGRAALRCVRCQSALAGGVVDGHTGLDIVDVDVETHALALVLHGPALHLHAAGHQIVPLKHRGHPVEHMIVRLLDVVRHQVFKGQHPLHIEIPSAGDEIFLVGVLPRQLIADQVAAVVEVLSIHTVVFHRVPAGGFHLADVAPVLRGHQVRAHIGVRRAAPAQSVQRAVRLKRGRGGPVLLGKGGLVAVQDHIGLPGIGRHILQREREGPGLRSLAAGQHQAAQQQGQQAGSYRFHHRR